MRFLGIEITIDTTEAEARAAAIADDLAARREIARNMGEERRAEREALRAVAREEAAERAEARAARVALRVEEIKAEQAAAKARRAAEYQRHESDLAARLTKLEAAAKLTHNERAKLDAEALDKHHRQNATTSTSDRNETLRAI